MTLYRKLVNQNYAKTLHNLWTSTVKRGYAQIVTGTEDCSTPHSRGLVLGVYSDELDKSDSGTLTPVATLYDEVINCSW